MLHGFQVFPPGVFFFHVFLFILYSRRQITRRNQIPFHHMYITISTLPLRYFIENNIYLCLNEKKKKRKRGKFFTRAVMDAISLRDQHRAL